MIQAGLKRYIQPFICYIKVDWWTAEVLLDVICSTSHPACLHLLQQLARGEGSCRGYSAVYSATLGKWRVAA